MHLVSTFEYVYFKDVSAPLESVSYLGPHAWYINLKEKRNKASKTKKEEKKELRQIQTRYTKGPVQQIIK